MMVTLGDPKGMSSIKLWKIGAQGVVFTHSIHYNELVTTIKVMNHTLVTGHQFGSVRMIDLITAQPLAVPQVSTPYRATINPKP